MKKPFYQDNEMKINQSGSIRHHKSKQTLFGTRTPSVDAIVAEMHAEEVRDAKNHEAAKKDPALSPYIR